MSAILTYTLSADRPEPLYEQLYHLLKKDILTGRIPAGSRLPSRRSLSKNLGISAITVEGAYDRLMDEGFVFSEASVVISSPTFHRRYRRTGIRLLSVSDSRTGHSRI